MKPNGFFVAVIGVVFTILTGPCLIQADEPLQIVTDVWPPYAFEQNSILAGTDVEIIQAVFAQLTIPIQIHIYPWKRCLYMMENRQADAILDASVTPERRTFLFFPEEPVSEGITVFFVKKGRQIPYRTLQDLNGLRAGALIGYSYCDEIDNAPFMKKAERVASLDQNFKKLMANRIDFFVEVAAVGHSTAKSLGISNQIEIIPNAHYCRGGNFLAFAKKPGLEELSSRFGKTLRLFKTTAAYREIIKKYGIDNQW
ncbi:MAG: substrate-binding periplasmic protein [Thermodesulfobacteriota bacterium]